MCVFTLTPSRRNRNTAICGQTKQEQKRLVEVKNESSAVTVHIGNQGKVTHSVKTENAELLKKI